MWQTADRWYEFPPHTLDAPHTGRAVMTVRLASCLVVATLALPTVARAQNDSTEALHATLRGWEDDARVTIFDRRGAFHGHLSERGILQRFNEGIDKEYSLDLVSSSFSMSEDYAWYTRRRGARWWAGSIDHRTLVQRAEIAGGTPLDGTWGFDFLFGQASTMQAKRTAVRATVRRSFSNDRVVGFLTGWLTAEKPEMDLEFGLQFKPGNSDITLAFAALDAFSDLIYQGLGVAGSQDLDYAPQPFTARIAMDVPLGRRFRYELYGLVMFPSRIIATNEPAAGGSFTQSERYAYGGGLFEWVPSRRTAVGAFGTWVGAKLDRASRDPGPSTDNFLLTEQTGRIGVYGMHRIRSRFLVEAHVMHVWRLEDRFRPDTTVESAIDYEDRSWIGRGSVTYRASSGFRAELGLDFVSRSVIGTDIPAGIFLAGDNSRVRFDFGWYFGQTAMLVLGTGADLDGDTQLNTPLFDGGHGRLQMFW